MGINCTRLAGLAQEELFAQARTWNRERIIRAVVEVGNWRLLPGGALLSLIEEGKSYECGEVQTWPALPGCVIFVGCNCMDEECNLSPLRRLMLKTGCGSPIACKHQYIRMLLSGHTIGVPSEHYAQTGEILPACWIRVAAKARLLK